MAVFDGIPGRLAGRQDLLVGTDQNLITWHDPPGSEPSAWALVVHDPLGGSFVSWTTQHEEVTFQSILFPMVAGLNVFGGIGAPAANPPGPYGSAVTVNIAAATSNEFKAMLIRVNK